MGAKSRSIPGAQSLLRAINNRRILPKIVIEVVVYLLYLGIGVTLELLHLNTAVSLKLQSMGIRGLLG